MAEERDSWVKELSDATAARLTTRQENERDAARNYKRWNDATGLLWKEIHAAVTRIVRSFNDNATLRTLSDNSDPIVDDSVLPDRRMLSLQFTLRSAGFSIVMGDENRSVVINSYVGGPANKTERIYSVAVENGIAHLRSKRGVIPTDQIGRELLEPWIREL
jgi:hypothetical protein